jgi:N-acetyl-gamma-glutamyl-phosphate reductase
MIRIGIVGASGFTGAELVRLLFRHPEAKIVFATSETYAGKMLSELYPALGPAGCIPLQKMASADLSPKNADLLFLGLPHGESMAQAPALAAMGVKIIDLSGDFRMADTALYEKWYHHAHTAKELAARAVYGLPELFRDQIKGATFVANPGCYVTSAVLALHPLVKSGWVDSETLIVDAKSSPSGAGRKPKPENMFTTVSENVIPYKMAGTHQHTPEMEMALSRGAGGRKVVLTFSPQLVPARRGILATVYGRLLRKASTDDLVRLFQETYAGEPFVSVRKPGEPWPDLASAVGSNHCVLGVAVDERTGLAVAVAAIDNLIKGASGQAVQNMNLLFNLDETLGLPRTGMLP